MRPLGHDEQVRLLLLVLDLVLRRLPRRGGAAHVDLIAIARYRDTSHLVTRCPFRDVTVAWACACGNCDLYVCSCGNYIDMEGKSWT